MQVDFIAEFTSFQAESDHAPLVKSWQVFMDGLSCRAGGRVRVHIITSKIEKYNYVIKLAFKTMNKEAEYEALLSGLVVAMSLGAAEIEVQADFQVVVNQVQGEFVVKSEKLKKYFALVEAEHPHFKYFQI